MDLDAQFFASGRSTVDHAYEAAFVISIGGGPPTRLFPNPVSFRQRSAGLKDRDLRRCYRARPNEVPSRRRSRCCAQPLATNKSGLRFVSLPLEARCQFGECLHWDPSRTGQWFVDIHGRTTYSAEVDTGEAVSRAMRQRSGWVIPRWQPAASCWSASGSVSRLYRSQVRLRSHSGQRVPLGMRRLKDAKADSAGSKHVG